MHFPSLYHSCRGWLCHDVAGFPLEDSFPGGLAGLPGA